MSGGVDSSVAAALLVEQGYEVIGVMLRLWSEPPPDGIDSDLAGSVNRCCSLESVNDARAVANLLGIPFYVVSAERQFREDVVQSFIDEYAAGLTPNPCLRCNRLVRFGFLLDYARELGARYLATGHYARVIGSEARRMELWRGIDRRKDQSYVLSVLGQPELASVMFPVGGFDKSHVRDLAAARGLPTASRIDSQDLCFVADGDYRRFLARYAPEAVKPGPIVDLHGRTLGRHTGLPNYTIGQRSGLGIAASEPLYIIELDSARNTIVVGTRAESGACRLRTGPAHWIAGVAPATQFGCQVQIRYRSTPMDASVTVQPDESVEIEFDEPVSGIAPGQAAVYYDGGRCLGSSLIRRL